MNGQSVVGTLTWNPNGSLGALAITDPFSVSNSQNCSYSHDDLSRIQNADCGAIWGQTFSYDAFGNLTGGVIGQPLVMEGVFSFFLESAFLGLFLFSEKRLTEQEKKDLVEFLKSL